MKRNVIVKILLDIAMLVLYLLLMFAPGLGGFFHEVAGLGIGILFLAHVILNRAMTKGLISSLVHGKTSPSKAHKAALLISDLCLTLFMPVTIVFGVFIARELFVFPAWLPFSLAFTIHNTLSYTCLWVMCIHLLLHGKYLVGVFKKLPLTTGRELGAAALRASATAAAAIAVYAGLFLYKTLPARAVSAAPEKITQAEFSSPSPLPSSSPSAAPAASPLITPTPRPTTAPPSAPPDGQASDSELSVPQDQSPAGEQSAIAAQNDSAVIEETPQPAPPVPSLQEYLSGLFCGGCGKNCPLLSPRCGRGQELAQTAEQEYYAMYPVSAGE